MDQDTTAVCNKQRIYCGVQAGRPDVLLPSGSGSKCPSGCAPVPLDLWNLAVWLCFRKTADVAGALTDSLKVPAHPGCEDGANVANVANGGSSPGALTEHLATWLPVSLVGASCLRSLQLQMGGRGAVLSSKGTRKRRQAPAFSLWTWRLWRPLVRSPHSLWLHPPCRYGTTLPALCLR